MITFAKDKMIGFTQEYADKMKHTCGVCHAKNVPVGLGKFRGYLVYICRFCVADRIITKIFEVDKKEIEFAERWMGLCQSK